MFKNIINGIKETIQEEYKFIIFMTIVLFTLNFPLDYYIIMGGGISDASTRIEVEGKQKSKGSFNISYVSQLDANLLFYGLSYIVPTWDREDVNMYKYTETEELEDIAFRSDLDLKTANGTATYWAYTLAKKKIKETSSKLFVIITYQDEYKTPLKVGDEIISIDNNEFKKIDEYSSYLQTKNENDEVAIKVIRNKKEQIVNAPVYVLDGRKLLGVSLQYVKEYETDPKVNIDFRKKESGPSGGLITTLEMYNQLTKKDLTKGYTIAGTGTIEEDGTIGQIGGIEHKILGAVAAKADYFLSPPGDNYKAAKKYIKEKKLKIKLIKVDKIQDAIEKLEGLD